MGRGSKGIFLTNENGTRGNRVGTIGTPGNISQEAWNRAVANQQRGNKLENMLNTAKGQAASRGAAILIGDGSQNQRRNKVIPAYMKTNTPASQKQKENAENALNSEIEYLINNAPKEKGLLVDPVSLRKDMDRFVKAVKNGNSKLSSKIAKDYLGALANDSIYNNKEQREEVLNLLERMGNLRKAYRNK